MRDMCQDRGGGRAAEFLLSIQISHSANTNRTEYLWSWFLVQSSCSGEYINLMEVLGIKR